MTQDQPAILTPLEYLRDVLRGAVFPFEVASAPAGRELCADSAHQLEDYIIPRYSSIDAPLLAVVGGSTGSGKSTLVNSLIGSTVTASSAIRPTTRRPVVICAPEDTHWFSDGRILPHLARVSALDDAEDAERDSNLSGSLELVASAAVPSGVALVDSPDIDSVVEENRRLASQLLSAADLWVFVTTAARYADAIPWALLDEAAERHIVIAVVLNRVPAGVGPQIRPDLAQRLRSRGLGGAPLFVVSEALTTEGFIPEGDISAIRGWLEGLVRDSAARASVARQTLNGAVRSLLQDRRDIVAALSDQVTVATEYEQAITRARKSGLSTIEETIGSGGMIRSEVLVRWQEVVGTGEWMKRLESGVSSLRDRMSNWFRGSSDREDTAAVEQGIEASVSSVLVAQAHLCVSEIRRQWEHLPSGSAILAAVDISSPSVAEEDQRETAARYVREWQRSLIEMIRDEGAAKRSTARALSVGVNALGASLMIVVFASTAGLTGGEVAIAGGTAVVAQRVLEAVFGDDAVRRMARSARVDLSQRAEAFFADYLGVYEDAIHGMGVSAEAAKTVDSAFVRVAADYQETKK